jgi:hypothetical protein
MHLLDNDDDRMALSMTMIVWLYLNQIHELWLFLSLTNDFKLVLGSSTMFHKMNVFVPSLVSH